MLSSVTLLAQPPKYANSNWVREFLAPLAQRSRLASLEPTFVIPSHLADPADDCGSVVRVAVFRDVFPQTLNVNHCDEYPWVALEQGARTWRRSASHSGAAITLLHVAPRLLPTFLPACALPPLRTRSE